MKIELAEKPVQSGGLTVSVRNKGFTKRHGSELLDKRRGIDLDSNGLPDIDWVEVPMGGFIYGGGNSKLKCQIEHLNLFKISKYPVTNKQFEAFLLADDGYQKGEWWEGLQKAEVKPNHQLGEKNKPAALMSWYEACAFCRWLSFRTDSTVRLPSEKEWEKAARGTDGRQYPWGDEYNDYACSGDESPLMEKYAVGIFPLGNSIYGVSDMLDNVWEWCLDENVCDEGFDYDASTECRAIRGGCFEDSIGDFNPGDGIDCTSRLSIGASDRGNDIGFRIVSI